MENLSLKAEGGDSSSSDQEMLDVADQSSFPDAQVDVSMKSKSIKSRGRKPVPIKWTRVICVDQIEDCEQEVH